jgi:hypothetical protein
MQSCPAKSPNHQSFQSRPVDKPITNINSIFHKQSVINFSQHLRRSSSLILLPHNFLQSRDPNLTRSSKRRSQRSLLLNISQLRAISCMETINMLKSYHSTNPGQGSFQPTLVVLTSPHTPQPPFLIHLDVHKTPICKLRESVMRSTTSKTGNVTKRSKYSGLSVCSSFLGNPNSFSTKTKPKPRCGVSFQFNFVHVLDVPATETFQIR